MSSPPARVLYVVACIVVLVWAWLGAGTSPGMLADVGDGAGELAAGFLDPDLSPAFLLDVAAAALQTVQIAVVGLILAVVVGGPLAVLLAGIVGAHPVVRGAARLISALLRGVPDLVWALLLVAAIGPGPAAGSLAIALHGIGMLAKLSAEQLEAVNPAPVEAVRLSGASRPATTAIAVLPQARAGLTSVTLYQFECNVRTSTVLGFVGAGGLGQEMAVSLRLFRYGELSTYVLTVLVLMLAIDALSRRARRHLGATVRECA